MSESEGVLPMSKLIASISDFDTRKRDPVERTSTTCSGMASQYDVLPPSMPQVGGDASGRIKAQYDLEARSIMPHRVKMVLRISKTRISSCTRTMHPHGYSVAAGETGSSRVLFLTRR